MLRQDDANVRVQERRETKKNSKIIYSTSVIICWSRQQIDRTT